MSSWIFLLISALLIVSGMFLCNYARSIAPSDEAIDGNITSENGQIISEFDYTDMNISTVSLDLENCQVEVRGGAKEAKVEMIGFRPNTFINSASNKTLRVSNRISLLDYLNFDGSGVSFSGVWQTLLSFTRGEDEADDDPQVIVHIPDEFDINQFSFSFTNCSVSVVNVGGECDLVMYALDSNVEFNQVTASIVDFEFENSDLSLLNNSFAHFDLMSDGGSFSSDTLVAEDITISGDEGEYKMLKTDFVDFSLRMDSCEIELESIRTQGSYQRDISIEKGEVYLGDLLIGTEDLSPEGETAPGTLFMTLTEGKVTCRYGSEQLVVDEAGDDTENPAEGGDNSTEPEA